jgi:hypothetical protein
MITRREAPPATGGAQAARAAGRRMDTRGQAARRAAVAGRGSGHHRHLPSGNTSAFV